MTVTNPIHIFPRSELRDIDINGRTLCVFASVDAPGYLYACLPQYGEGVGALIYAQSNADLVRGVSYVLTMRALLGYRRDTRNVFHMNSQGEIVNDYPPGYTITAKLQSGR